MEVKGGIFSSQVIVSKCINSNQGMGLTKSSQETDDNRDSWKDTNSCSHWGTKLKNIEYIWGLS